MNLFLGAAAAVLAGLQGAAPQSETLTLEEALAIADQNAFSVRIAQSNVEKGRQNLSASRASLGPRVGLNGTYTRFAKETVASFGAGSPPVVVQPIDSTTVAASLQVPLDISGNLRRQVQATEHGFAATRFQAQTTTNDLHQQVKRSFFGVLRAQGLVGVAEAALRSAQERAATNEKLFQADQIAKVDLQRVQAQVAQSESDLITAQASLRLAQNSLNFVLGRPIETPAQPVDVTSLPEAPSDPAPLVERAQTARPEVLALGETARALERSRRAQEAGMNPSLAFTLNHQRSLGATSGFGGGSETTTGVLALSVPLWDGGITRDRVRAARQDELQARINLEQVQLGVSQEVRGALTNLESARARLAATTRQVTLAEEVLRLAGIRQQAGEGTYLEIVDAETQLTQARNQAVSARYDYLTAYADLQHAMGTDAVPAATPTAPTGGTQ